MQNKKRALGITGEHLAAEYLAGQGVSIIARNVRTGYGELDLIGYHAGILVIFEVKTRRSDTYGFPEDSVSTIKRQHLISSAEEFIQKHPELPSTWRIDVIAIKMRPDQSPEIEWFENAVS